MFDKFLSIGSVVLLRGHKTRIMITGYRSKKENSDEVYDYSACVYPLGLTAPEELVLFNHDAIETVFGVGYKTDEFFKLNSVLNEKSAELAGGDKLWK